MLLHFSKCHHLSIWSSSIWIKFNILSFISVFTALEVSLATASSAVAEYSFIKSASSSSGNLLFLSCSWPIPIFIRWSSIILVNCFTLFFYRILHIFSYLDFTLINFFFIVFLNSTLSSCHLFFFIVLFILWTIMACFCLYRTSN